MTSSCLRCAASRSSSDRDAARLVELVLKPAVTMTARFGIVTLAGRAEAPALPIVRKLVEKLMHD